MTKTIKIKRNVKENLNSIVLITILSIIVNLFVYFMGGTNGSWPQLNIVIIIISAYLWNSKSSIIVAIVLGLIVGPLMPLDVSLGIMQSTENWMFRLVFYLFIGSVTGHLTELVKEKTDMELRNSLIDPQTGFYNLSKWFNEINSLLVNEKRFSVIFINFANVKEIGEYADYSTEASIYSHLKDYLKRIFQKDSIYALDSSQYLIITNSNLTEKEIENKLVQFKKYIELEKIDNRAIRLVSNIGIICINEDSCFSAQEILSNVRIASNTGTNCKDCISFYDNAFAKKRRDYLKISASLKNAIVNDEFYLVYQPIFDIRENKILETEVLTRWKRGNMEIIEPSIFINIAEKTGQINDLSMHIIEKNLQQIIEWRNSGINIKTSVNLSGDELLDENFYMRMKDLLDQNHINRKELGIEITERQSINNIKIKQVLKDLIAKGCNISLDDFGTGYNSLVIVGEFPCTSIKIDKYFIDRIDKKEIHIVIKHLIDSMHALGKKVVAEGVETQKQYKILKDLECDKIQGYYFSKPLLPNEFEKFYIAFNTNTKS